MIQKLTPFQSTLLRRCDGGLRVWEAGEQLVALKAELAVLCELGLVSFDDDGGYQLTAAGDSSLIKAGF